MKQSKARQREAFPPTTKKFRKKARTSSLNANADGDILKYRKYGLVDYYRNKAAGFYVSHKA